uniref:Retrotransposon protein, putative, Ty1-copia subclass n=1 Tax=Tanacetum cinerariifolium TaxID=118510 RepID=A0A6L2L2S7_TANCI|nr:hypothetical protein [Tanacetum cinerariifolium]
MGKTTGELHAMLIEYEKGLPKKAEISQVMMIKGGKIQKSNKKALKAKGKGKANGKGNDNQVYIPKPKNPKPAAKEHPTKDDTCHHCKEGKANGKGNDKQVYIPKPKNPKPAAKEHPTKDDTCHHCKEVGHWKRNYPVYLAELLKKKKQVGSASSLDNCYYAPSIIRGVSVHRLVENGFVQCFMDFGISVSKNNVCYFNAIPSNGIYEIDMHDLVPNANSIYNVSTKRAKHNLDSTYLWHCHLAHISKKRIEKLQQKGLLKSTYDESFDQCVSCLSGKMTRKLFPHRPERATDLLGIIHTDVCGPLRHVSRYGASYFITFTDDYSRYGYVYLLKHKHELTPLYTPQHNGVSERRNRTLLDMVDKTPYELWYAKVSNLSYLKVWGCEVLVKRDTPDKLQQRSVKCIFIGYPKETMGYYFYFPSENKIVVVRYAEFFEKNLITQEVSGRDIDLEEIQDEDTSPSEIISKIPIELEGFEPPQEEVISIRRSERTHRAPTYLCLNVEVDKHSLGDLNEPASYKAAMLDLEYNKWIDAMNVEIQSMIDNMVWVLVDLPPGCKTVGKTFSLVADIGAIRILISIAAFYDYEIWQIDVKTAFLNGYHDEDIYMVQPEGFVDLNYPRKVCKLQKSIYGLKQSSRLWNKRFDEEIKKFSFAQSLDEPCVYQKASGSNVTFLILYVDDIIIMGNHISSLQSVKDYLGKCFAMKDLGEATFIFEIKIYRDRSKRLIGLGQNAYMDKVLKRYKMDNSKRGHIPMQERLDLNKTQGASTPKEVKRMQNVPYASAVGSIMYAARCTRPDVAFAQNITSRFQQNPAGLRVDCYCDAGFETNRDDTKSLTGYVFILNGGAVD